MDASSGFSSTSESQSASTKSVPGSELGVSQPPFILRTKQSKKDSYKLCTKHLKFDAIGQGSLRGGQGKPTPDIWSSENECVSYKAQSRCA